MVTQQQIKDVVVELLRQSVTRLPADVVDAIQKAHDIEDGEVPKMQLRTILDNIKMAQDTGTPMCQDTGIHIFFVDIGTVEVEGDIENAIREGVKQATDEVPLRPNAVHPITRDNPGTNNGLRMPYVVHKRSSKPYMEITAMPKGAGSENMSASVMLTPSQGLKGIKQFALDTILHAGGKPCPPIIVGMGIGGSADISMKLAKESLLRPLGEHNSDPAMAELETELLTNLNQLGIGPMGLGGKTTILGLNIEHAFCHTASLPVAINIQCWAGRRATARITSDGSVDYVTHKGGDL